jgi:PPM family protein phosphatase
VNTTVLTIAIVLTVGVLIFLVARALMPHRQLITTRHDRAQPTATHHPQPSIKDRTPVPDTPASDQVSMSGRKSPADAASALADPATETPTFTGASPPYEETAGPYETPAGGFPPPGGWTPSEGPQGHDPGPPTGDPSPYGRPQAYDPGPSPYGRPQAYDPGTRHGDAPPYGRPEGYSTSATAIDYPVDGGARPDGRGEPATAEALADTASGQATQVGQVVWPPSATEMAPAALRLRTAARTSPGDRGVNADGYLILEGLVAVADGVGGTRLSAQASALALGAIVVGRAQSGVDGPEALDEWMVGANRTVRTARQRDPRQSELATTLDVLLLDPAGQRVLFAHTGNSSIWHRTAATGVVLLLTEPHSAGEGLQRGIGLADHPYHDRNELPVRPGDRLLLATDGLTRRLEPQRIAELLLADVTPETCAGRLVAAARNAGSNDDTTVVVADIVIDPEAA